MAPPCGGNVDLRKWFWTVCLVLEQVLNPRTNHHRQMELQRVSHSDWFPRIHLMDREYRQIWTKIKKTFWAISTYLVWGRGDSSLIENKSLEAVEPWLGAAAGVDQLAAAPKLILFEGTDDFFGFSWATLNKKFRFSKIWMETSRDQGSAVGRTDPDRSFPGQWGTGVRESLRMRFGLTEVQKLNWLLVLVQL